MKHMYGFLGFLSLLGLLGIFTEERTFLAFFGFAVDFQYFFRKTDEMMVEYMNKSAARAFFFGMAATAAATLLCAVSQGMAKALVTGIACGWVVSVLVYALSSVYYGIRESWWAADD